MRRLVVEEFRPSYAQQILEQSIETLLQKAAKAKAHAKKLYADIEMEAVLPSWGEKYTTGGSEMPSSQTLP